MLASMAIVSGFKREITRKVVGFNSDIQLTALPSSPEEGNVARLDPTLSELLDGAPFVAEHSLQASVPAVLKTPDDYKGVYLRASSDSTSAAFLASNLEEGEVPSDPAAQQAAPGSADEADGLPEPGAGLHGVAISRQAASRLGLEVGDRVDAYFFSDDIRARRLKVSGIFNSHFDSYDKVMAFSDLPLVQGASGLAADEGSSVKVAVRDFDRLEENADWLRGELDRAYASGRLDRRYLVTTALEAGSGYFQWLQLLDTNVVVVLTLMVIVGCVTLVSGMLIMILDKKRFIGLLKALGTPTTMVRRVFVWLAVRVALAGMVAGNLLGLALLWVQREWHVVPLDPESYYIDFVPVSLEWGAFLLLNLAVVAIVYLVLILPSRFVAGISPAETMRTE